MAGSDVKAVFIEADTDAADPDGVCASQTPGSGGNLTLQSRAPMRMGPLFLKALPVLIQHLPPALSILRRLLKLA